MYQHKEIFDLSNYPKDSKYFCNDSKKVLGKMNNEYGAIPIDEYIVLRSKMYSIRDIKKDEVYIKDIIHILVVMNIMMHFLIKKFLDIK